MRISRVPGMPVVDTHVARQAGVVSDVLLDMQGGRIAVLNVKHGDGWQVQRIPAEYVYRLGPHTVLVADTVAVDLGPPHADERWFPIESLVGLQVMTEGGDNVGQLQDADVDDKTLAVRSYLLRKPSGLFRRPVRIQPQDVIACSYELMVIREKR